MPGHGEAKMHTQNYQNPLMLLNDPFFLTCLYWLSAFVVVELVVGFLYSTYCSYPVSRRSAFKRSRKGNRTVIYTTMNPGTRLTTPVVAEVQTSVPDTSLDLYPSLNPQGADPFPPYITGASGASLIATAHTRRGSSFLQEATAPPAPNDLIVRPSLGSEKLNNDVPISPQSPSNLRRKKINSPTTVNSAGSPKKAFVDLEMNTIQDINITQK
jgi:hypothetical protein